MPSLTIVNDNNQFRIIQTSTGFQFFGFSERYAEFNTEIIMNEFVKAAMALDIDYTQHINVWSKEDKTALMNLIQTFKGKYQDKFEAAIIAKHKATLKNRGKY